MGLSRSEWSAHLEDLYQRAVIADRKHRWGEVESLYRQLITDRVKKVGKHHPDTFFCIHWLGHAIYKQQKYVEAEVIFRQLVDDVGKILGKQSEDLFVCMDSLGRALFMQDGYSEAEEYFRQAGQGYTKLYGKYNQDTINVMVWLDETLTRLGRESEAINCPGVGGRDKTKTFDEHALNMIVIDQSPHRNPPVQISSAISRPTPVQLTSTKQTPQPLSSTPKKNIAHTSMIPSFSTNIDSDKNDDKNVNNNVTKVNETSGNAATSSMIHNQLNTLIFANHTNYTDSDIIQISSLLSNANPRWSEVPRTYILLRILDQLHFLDQMIDLGFSDHWLPVTEIGLPDCLSQGVRASFVHMQEFVMTNSMILEKGEKGQHCQFKKGDTVPLRRIKLLGSGGFGEVDKVSSLISHKDYARKLVRRSVAFRGPRSKYVKYFIAEIQIMKRLKHRHIVNLVGSYTDTKYIALLMLPIAETDLSAYLSSNRVYKRELREFFGCLVTALEYLHGEKIRHKDIKPRNILVNRGQVLFTDFGLSHDFEDASGSTTASMSNGRTPRYCAPEVAHDHPRNTKSDIWSLGVVFMEMLVVLKGLPVQYLNEFFRLDGADQGYIRTNLEALPAFITTLEQTGKLSDNRVLCWIRPMLAEDHRQRPTAKELASLIKEPKAEAVRTEFCGLCCQPDGENGLHGDLGDFSLT